MFAIKFNVKNTDGLRQIAELGRSIQTDLTRKAVQAGARIFLARIKAIIPQRTRTMLGSIIENTKYSSRNKNRMVGLVGSNKDVKQLIRKKKSNFTYVPSAILHIVEYGRKNPIDKLGRNIGTFLGRKFMSKSFSQARDEAEQKTIDTLTQGLNKL